MKYKKIGETLMKRCLTFLVALILLLGLLTSSALAEEKRYKEKIVVAFSTKLTNIDPQSVNNVQHKRLFLLMFDGLVNVDPQTNELSPGLAERWELSEDGLSWTFYLRQDVKFHNGEPFTADDVVFTIERGKASAVGSARGMFTTVDNVVAVDDYTVQLNLAKINMDMLYILAQPGLGMLNREAVESDPDKGPYVGCGPWKFNDFREGDYVLLERFDDYYGKKSPTKFLELRHIAENSARLISLQNDEIDVCLEPNNIELDFIRDDPNLKLVQQNGTNLQYFAFNMQREPGNNPAFRQAVSHAINMDEIILAAFEGMGVQANSFWSWAQYGYNADIQPYEYNPDKAKQIVDENGLAGTVLKIMTTGAERILVVQILQAQLAPIGIKVELEEVDSAGFTSLTNAGEHQACIYGITYVNYGDDARHTHAAGSTTNKSHQNNPRIQELMDLALAETNEEQRLKYYHEWQQIAHDEIAVIPLIYQTLSVAINKDVEGIAFEPGGIHDFSGVYREIK